jgi:hypothetical protein
MNSSSNYWTSTSNDKGNNGVYNTIGKAYYFDNNTKKLVNGPNGSSYAVYVTNPYKTFPVYSY